MFYMDQLRSPSFPIGLVKTESGFETDLGRWRLVVAVISVDAYPFLAFVRPDNVPPDSKETKLGGSEQEDSPSEVSHELTAYFSIFNQFELNKLWPYYQKHVNKIVLNSITL